MQVSSDMWGKKQKNSSLGHVAAVLNVQTRACFQAGGGTDVTAYLWDKDEAVDRGCTHKDASRGKTKQQVVPSTEEAVN